MRPSGVRGSRRSSQYAIARRVFRDPPFGDRGRRWFLSLFAAQGGEPRSLLLDFVIPGARVVEPLQPAQTPQGAALAPRAPQQHRVPKLSLHVAAIAPQRASLLAP